MNRRVVFHLRNSDRLGGPERLILDQAARASADLPVVLASFVRAGTTNAFLEEAARRGIATAPIAQRHSYDRRIVRGVRAAIGAAKAAVLIGHDYKANLVLSRASSGSGLPRVAVVHGYTAENWKIRLFERIDRRRLPSASAVVAVSESVAATVLAAGVPADRLHRIENGIDVDRVASESAAGRASVRHAFGVGDGEVLAMSIGRLSPEKGHRVLLDAWERLGAAAPRLVLVGDGASRAGLEARAARLQPGKVTFTGWRTDPTTCIGAADIAILPSLTEGLPLALLEAMAAGVAVVATRVGGMPAALDEGRAGLLIPPGDPVALADAVEELSDSADGRARLSAGARSRVRACYDVSRQAAALEALYRRLHGDAPVSR